MEKKSLKMVRASLRLSQMELADLAKVSQQTITDIERKKVRPRLTTAFAIVDALNVKLREAGREEITVESLDWEYSG
jgi:DNA-binding XRE family transcriptional regulator